MHAENLHGILGGMPDRPKTPRDRRRRSPAPRADEIKIVMKSAAAGAFKRQVGHRLALAIQKLNKRQVDVIAEIKTVKVSPSNLGNWIRGDDFPNILWVREFCRLYGVSMDWIYLEKVDAMASPLAADLLAALQEPEGE